MINQNGAKADVVIIGAGVIGICTAYFLSQSGRKILVVDKDEVCSGCSYGNAGLIVPSYCVPLAEPGVIKKGMKWMLNPESPFYIKPRLDRDLLDWLWRFRRASNEAHVKRSMPVIRDLTFESLRLYNEIIGSDGIDFGLEQRGSLFLCNTMKAMDDLVVKMAQLQSVGIEAELLDQVQTQEKVGELKVNAVGSVFYPQDAHLQPARFVRELAQKLIESGVKIQSKTEVLGFEKTGNRLTKVRTTRGDIDAKEVVIASGAWSPAIARELGLRLKIQPGKGYSITLERPKVSADLPLMLVEMKVGVTPMGDTIRIAGTLEMAGMDFAINERRVQGILKSVPHYLPDIDPNHCNLIEVWRGLRPCTPDGLPYLGRAENFENLTVAAGHAMIGVSLGPVTGRIASNIVLRKDPGFDLNPLRLNRFN
jgi:D-amino-acid dehydrogenase